MGMLPYIMAAIAFTSLIVSVAMYFFSTAKVNKFESNCIATLNEKVHTLEKNNTLQWERIDEMRESLSKDIREMNDTVIRLDERTRTSETLYAIVKKAMANGGGK